MIHPSFPTVFPGDIAAPELHASPPWSSVFGLLSEKCSVMMVAIRILHRWTPRSDPWRSNELSGAIVLVRVLYRNWINKIQIYYKGYILHWLQGSVWTAEQWLSLCQWGWEVVAAQSRWLATSAVPISHRQPMWEAGEISSHVRGGCQHHMVTE